MVRDLRHAVRLLFQAKGWTAVILLSLALGIGANIALFSVVNGLLLKTIPVRDPGSLVRLRWAGPNDMRSGLSSYGMTLPAADGRDTNASFSYPMYKQFVASNATMSDLAVGAPYNRVNLAIDGQAELARAYISSGNYYRMLGVRAALGRLIEDADDRPEAPAVAVISAQYWRTRFAGDRQVIGRTVKIGTVPLTIVGVISEEFTGTQVPIAEPADIGLPLSLHDRIQTGQGPLNDEMVWWLLPIGRLKPGATPEQVQANLSAVFQQTARAGMDRHLASLSEEVRGRSDNQNRTRVPGLLAQPAAHGIYDISRTEIRSATMLSTVVGLVLLIVCANVANLLLSRATTRQKEISIRLSMGATRGRLVRQMLTESLLIAGIGGALGVMVGYWGRSVMPASLGRPGPFDLWVALFSLAIVAITGVVFGLAPALTATRVSLNTTLKEQARGVVGSRRWLSKGLLVTQVALTLALLVGSALFLRTIQNLRHVDVGFNPNNLGLFSVNPQLIGYDNTRRTALFSDMLQQLRSVPGVRGVALSQPALLSGSVNSTRIFVQGRSYERGARTSDDINRLVVSPNFFDTMEMPVRAGRGLTDRDVQGTQMVAVLNEAAVRRYFPTSNPIGQRFGPSIETSGQIEIVGIVRDAKYSNLREDIPPTMYQPYLQRPIGSAIFEVRTAGDPSAAVGSIRELVRRIDPNLPVTNVTTQMEQIETRYQQEKAFAQVYTLFGGIALVLASIGLFGLMSYAVSRRTNEIGIRMALGAQPRGVLSLILGESTRLVAVGIAVGLAGVIAAGRFVRAFLYGVPPTDVLSIAAAIIVMVGVTALAAYLPARRASRVSPLVALRSE
jgi:predicted permease